MRKALLFISLLFMSLIVTLTSCGGDDEATSNTDIKTEQADIKQLIVGYWSSFSTGQSTIQYSFASFNDKGEYAIYLDDDIFSSGTYTVNDSTIALYDGYNGTSTSLNVKATDQTLTVKKNGVSYNGEKTENAPVDLDYIFIGKTYTFYFFMNPTPLTFNTKYSATQEYQYTTTKKLCIYWQYVYNGNKYIYAKKYNDPNVHTLVGGYNTFTKGKVYIYDTSLSNGNIENMTLLNSDK